MDRRKKRTSTNQYMMYIEMMESDKIFATGRVPRDGDLSYLQKKWKELSDRLNMCNGGPRLTAEEWRKRLNDWKNTTRCKYRRSISGEKDITLTALEKRALDLFGTAPNASLSSDQLSLHLKSEKYDDIDDEVDHQPSEAFQKELQAAVEEAIGNDDVMREEQDDQDEVLPESIDGNMQTIVVENANFTDDDNNDEAMEFITQRRHPSVTISNPVSSVTNSLQTSSPPTTSVTKLINGEIPLKRLRTQVSEQIIYEVKKASIAQPTTRTITIHNTTAPLQQHHITQNHNQSNVTVTEVPSVSAAAIAATATPLPSGQTTNIAGITQQLKRIADIKVEKLKFEIAKFKFNNPGFNYNYPTL